MRWRNRSVSTRVLPDPAGAMTRAGPRSWPTASSWSAASSPAGSTRRSEHGGTAGVDRFGVDHRAERSRGPRAGVGRRRSRPACRRRVARRRRERSRGQRRSRRRRCRGAAGRPCVPTTTTGRLATTVVVVRPHEEVQAVEPRLGGGECVHGSPVIDCGAPERRRVDGEADDDGSSTRPAGVEPLDHVACGDSRVAASIGTASAVAHCSGTPADRRRRSRRARTW